jgi:pimeloyl-ACP methyl ester carboxylesterase
MTEIVNGFDDSIVDERASNVGPAGIDIVYQRLGKRDAPLLLLIMGGGAQSIAWPDAFCHALVDRGLQIVRFDNRDVGLSTHITGAPPPDIRAALGIEQAHVVGASLGGAVGQRLAIEHPRRVRSLTSMMSTTGDTSVGQVSPDVLRDVFSGPPAVTRDEVVARMIRAFRVIGSPAYPIDEHEAAERTGRAFDRSYDPAGMARQALAMVADGDRTALLRRVDVPALVIHGLADRMCDVSGGRATADAIPAAELFLVEGMGHNLPPGLHAPLAARIADFVWRVEHR